MSVRAWESDESALRVQIVPAFGKVPISSVSSVQIEQFLTELAVSRSVPTAARVRTTLRGLFRYAVRTRRLAQSAAESVPLPHPDSRTGKVVEVQSFHSRSCSTSWRPNRKLQGGTAMSRWCSH